MSDETPPVDATDSNDDATELDDVIEIDDDGQAALVVPTDDRPLGLRYAARSDVGLVRQGNEDGAHRAVQRMAKRLPTRANAPRTVVRSGLLSSQLLAHETGDNIVDPVTMLISSSSDEQ